MNTGTEIPFRRSRRGRGAKGSLIFDRQHEEHLRMHGQDDAMWVWSNGHFRKRDLHNAPAGT